MRRLSRGGPPVTETSSDDERRNKKTDQEKALRKKKEDIKKGHHIYHRLREIPTGVLVDDILKVFFLGIYIYSFSYQLII